MNEDDGKVRKRKQKEGKKTKTTKKKKKDMRAIEVMKRFKNK